MGRRTLNQAELSESHPWNTRNHSVAREEVRDEFPHSGVSIDTHWLAGRARALRRARHPSAGKTAAVAKWDLGKVNAICSSREEWWAWSYLKVLKEITFDCSLELSDAEACSRTSWEELGPWYHSLPDYTHRRGDKTEDPSSTVRLEAPKNLWSLVRLKASVSASATVCTQKHGS